MNVGLATASQISGIISGVVVVGGAAAACWKWNAIGQILVRILEGHARRGDLEIAEEGLANHPELQAAATAARQGLRIAHLRQAERRMADLQGAARRRAAHGESNENEAPSRTPSSRQGRATSTQVQPTPVQARPGRVDLQTNDVEMIPFRSIGLTLREQHQEETGRPKRGLPTAKGGHTGRATRGNHRASPGRGSL